MHRDSMDKTDLGKCPTMLSSFGKSRKSRTCTACSKASSVIFFVKADKSRGVTGENLLVMLERRLDNTLYRLGFASSRDQARQLVRHNHFLVNGHKVNIPSFQVNVGDIISLKEKSRKNEMITDNLEGVARRGVPSWLELDASNSQGTVKALPNREEITMPIQEQLVVELYSK